MTEGGRGCNSTPTEIEFCVDQNLIQLDQRVESSGLKEVGSQNTSKMAENIEKTDDLRNMLVEEGGALFGPLLQKCKIENDMQCPLLSESEDMGGQLSADRGYVNKKVLLSSVTYDPKGQNVTKLSQLNWDTEGDTKLAEKFDVEELLCNPNDAGGPAEGGHRTTIPAALKIVSKLPRGGICSSGPNVPNDERKMTGGPQQKIPKPRKTRYPQLTGTQDIRKYMNVAQSPQRPEGNVRTFVKSWEMRAKINEKKRPK